MSHAAAKSFESIVQLALEKSGVRLCNIPRQGGKYVGKDQFIRDIAPCDFIGAINGAGRMFICDAKTCEHPTRFEMRKIAEHQYEELVTMKQAGAVAGVIVELEHIRRIKWLDASELFSLMHRPSIAIDWSGWVDLGSSSVVPDLGKILLAAAPGRRSER